jgi:hypothetical protein
MSTPEGKVKDKVKDILREFGVYWHCPVQNGMGAPGLDFWCCHNGVFFGIETKAPGKRPTPRQAITIDNVRKAGGVVFVIDGTYDDPTILTTYEGLKLWLTAQRRPTP